MARATAAIAGAEVTAAGRKESARPVGQTRTRDFWLLLGGFSVSTLGNRISTIAYPLLALAITGSAADAGWTGFAAVAPSILLYFPAGLLADRAPPRRLMLVSECGRGVLLAGVVALLVFGDPQVWQLATAAAAEQSLRVFAELGERRLTSSLLSPGEQQEGLGRSETSGHTAILVGRPLGGLLLGVGWVWPFAGNLLSVCVSLVTLLPIRSGRSGNGSASGPSEHGYRLWSRLMRQDAAKAWTWWRANPFARLALPITAGTTFIGQALIMVFLIEAHTRHESPLEIGLVLGASGVGGAVGGAVAFWYFEAFEYVLLHRQLWIWTGALALLWLASGRFLTIMTLTLAAMGFTGALGNIAVDTYLVRRSGPEMFGRLVSIDRITSLIGVALGPLVGGLAMQDYGLRTTIALLFFIALALALAAYLEPTMRTSNRLPSLAPTGGPTRQLSWATPAASSVVLAAAALVVVALSLRLGA